MAEIIDLRNFRCPQTIIALKKMRLSDGKFKIITAVTDSSDIVAWAHRSGHKIIDHGIFGNERRTEVEITT